MKIGFEVFLVVCEEMSVTRAARRLFITQQAVSDHIRRLEEKYGISLFQRKPDFHLTAEGEIMRSSLQQMKIMEKSFRYHQHDFIVSNRMDFKIVIRSRINSDKKVDIPLAQSIF